MGSIWFATPEGTIPPSYVYIEIMDRQTNTKYRSNLADTTLDAVDQPPCRLDMKARRSNSITSCSFLSSAPCSGGIALVGSRS